MTTIYALSDPSTGEIRYVGKTATSLLRRRDGHVSDSRRRRGHRFNWIRSLDTSPAIRALFVVPDDFGSAMEVRTIAALRAKGYRLTNVTAGGEGAPGIKASQETRAKLSAAARNRTPEHRARLSASMKGHRNRAGHSHSLEQRERIAAAQRGRSYSPETIANMRAAHVGKTHRPETIAKIRAACVVAAKRRIRP